MNPYRDHNRRIKFALMFVFVVGFCLGFSAGCQSLPCDKKFLAKLETSYTDARRQYQGNVVGKLTKIPDLELVADHLSLRGRSDATTRQMMDLRRLHKLHTQSFQDGPWTKEDGKEYWRQLREAYRYTWDTESLGCKNG